MLAVSVLGPVEAHRDGVRLPLPGGRSTELLARLALAAGAAVRTDTLLDELWDGHAARNTLQSKVSQLRRALGSATVVAAGDGYRLALPADAVDASRAVALATAGAAARTEGRPAEALRLLAEGLALFRGEVLVEVGDWAAPHRTRLEEVRLNLLEESAEARLDLGGGGELVPELEGLVDRFPWRERLWAALMTALYRAGRQADALAAYARVRRHLVDELGVEPGPALRALEQQVLRQSASLGVAGGTTLVATGNLPESSRSVLPRDDEVAAVLAALGRSRLVTLTGLGGVGKTRLSLEVGRRLSVPGGVWFVRLEAVGADARLGQVVAETLHLPGEDALRERLAGAETVLLLDGCEHLAAAVALLVEALLAGVPHLRVLATSQVPLGLDAEHQHAVLPLDADQSVALFTLRAQEARRRWQPDDQTAALVVDLCRALDGLPLAIELAAARVRSLSVPDIARRLDDRFALLRDPGSTGRERHRTLVGAVAWSYDLLFPDDQRGLRALACFADGAGLEGFAHVLAALDVPDEAVVDVLGRLVDRSLVVVDDGPSGVLRYRLLESVRRFAADRLAESGLGGTADSAHADWYLRTGQWCEAHVRGPDQPTCLALARAERADVDAALAWCARDDPVRGARTALAWGWTWVVLGDGTAGAARVRDALVGELTVAEQITGHLLAGWLEASAGDVGVADADIARARDLAAATGDPLLLADVDRYAAFVAIQQGRPDLTRALAGRSLTTYRRLGRAWPVAASLLLGAFGALLEGAVAQARLDATEAVALVEELGDAWGLVHGRAMLGAVAQAEGRSADAVAALEGAAAESTRLGFTGQAALHRATLARVRHRVGDPAAEASYRRAIAEAAAGGDGRLLASTRLNLARLRRAQGVADEAAALLVTNERWYAAAGGGDFALLNAAVLAAVRDDGLALDDVLALARDEDDHEAEVVALDAQARRAAQAGDAQAAEMLLAAADRVAARIPHLLDDADRVDAARARALLAVPGQAAGAGSPR